MQWFFILNFHLSESLHKQPLDLDLITCCVGELCTINRHGIPWPAIYGIGVNIKTGDIFPGTFADKGPDLDIRTARTLAGGENVSVSEDNVITKYDCDTKTHLFKI